MPWQETLVYVLAHFIWQSALVAGLLVLLSALFRIDQPGPRYAASLFAFVVMSACPIVTWYVVTATATNSRDSELLAVLTHIQANSLRVDTVDDATSAASRLLNRDKNVPQRSHVVETANSSIIPTNVIRLKDIGLVADQTAKVTIDQRKSTDSSRSWETVLRTHRSYPNWIVAFWISGVSLLSVRLAIGVAGTWFWRLNVDALTEDLAKQVQQLCQVMSVSMPRVRLSHRITEALVVGLWKPMILVPVAWVTELPPDMFEAVLAHELAHIRRFDLWVNLGQRIVETLLFYHPAVWWLSRRLRMERELCCDAVAVRSTRNPVRYAETLAHIAVLVRAPRVAGLAIGISATKGVLLRRVRQLLGATQPQPAHHTWIAGIFTFVVALAVGFGMFAHTATERSFVHANAEEIAVPTNPQRDVDSKAGTNEIAIDNTTSEKPADDSAATKKAALEVADAKELPSKIPAENPNDQFRDMLDPAIQARVATKNIKSAELLVTLAHKPSVTILRQLLASSGEEQPEPVQLLDNPRSGKTEEGDFVIPINTPHGRITVVGCKVVPLNGQRADETNQDELPDAAFLFDAQGRLIARLGGECGASDPKARDSIDLINMGPEEDWFVRVKRLETEKALKRRTDYYRIDNPVICSLRCFHDVNSNVSSSGLQMKPRLGRLYFDSDRSKLAKDQPTASFKSSESVEQPDVPESQTPLQLSQPLAKVIIEGNKSISDAEIMKHIKIRGGQPVTSKQIKNDVDALIRLRWFAHVEPSFKQTDEGLVLRFVVVERPRVQRVEYKGLRNVTQKTLDALTQLKPGSPFDIGSNRESVRRIEEYYREKGFAFATVELEKGNDRLDREVVFAIKEGPKNHSYVISFEGNSRVLRIRCRTDKDRVESNRESAKLIENYYHDRGYAFATVEIEQGNNPDDGEVDFVIKEGPRIYMPGTKSVMGNQIIGARTDLTKEGVNVIPELIWDGDRNRFVGVAFQSADGHPLYQVDAAWSREFEAFIPNKNQLVISGGGLDYDHWYSWGFVVPENCEAIVRMSIIQQNGDTSKLVKNLDAGVHSVLLQVKPSRQSASTQLSLKCDGDKPEELKLPNRFDHPLPDSMPVVQVVDAGSPARILEVSDTAGKVSLKAEVELRRP